MPRTQRGAKCCAAEPGPKQSKHLGPGSAEQRCTLHRVRDTKEAENT
jgi:hypothetical protein